MSAVDNRIVRMQFDNEQFERGVIQSMRTLDELNEKLQFKEAGKGISALQVHLNNVDFSGIQNAVQHINHSFTSMTGMVAQRIKEDIVDNVINAAKRLEQVTLGQIKSGGMARAKNIANAKFMIEGLKFDWEAVRQAADYAVTDTAYGLDAAAKAASQLAASGVDFMETIEEVNGTKLTQMHKSLRAISGVAAMTNSSYEEIAHIFTSVAGMGKLTAMQMNQLSLRGLNIASTIAEQTGKTEQEIREMVSKGMIDFQMFSEAMDNAYGEHAKEANKTFEGSLSNLKAALSRIGAIFTQPVIDKTNTFFVALTGRIKEFQKALSDDKDVRITEKALKRITKQANDEARAHKLSGTAYVRYVNDTIAANKKAILENKASLTNGDAEEYSIARFATHFAEAWEAAINYVSKVTESLDLSWFKSIGSFLDTSAQKVTKFFNSASTAIDKVKASVDKTSASIADSLELDMNDLDLLHRILKNEFGYVEERWAKLDEIYKKQGSTKTGLWLQGYMDQLAGVGYHFEKLGWTEEEFKKKQEDLAKSEAQRVSEMSREEVLIYGLSRAYENATKMMTGVKDTVSNLITAFSNVANAVGRVFLNFGSNFRTNFPIWKITDGVSAVSKSFVNLTEAITPSVETLLKVGDAGKKVGETLAYVADFIFDTTTKLIDFVASCLAANESLDDLAKNESLTSMQRAVLDVMRVVNNLRRLLAALGKIAIKIFKSIKTAFMNVFGGQELGGALTAVTGGFTLLTDGIATAAEKVAESEAPFKVIETLFGTIFLIVRKVSDLLGKFTTGIRKFKNGTEDTIDVANDAIKVGERSSSLVEGLGKTFAKGVKWITELPSKLKTLLETVKKQEGVVHLKESVENLWKTMKDAVTKGMDPMTKSMNEVSRVTGGEGETALGALADGIGKVADKIAEFLDKLPEYGNKIKKFFEDTKAWFDKTIADLHLDELGGGLADAFTEIFSSDKSIFAKVGEFAENIFWQIVDALAGVNWKEVGKGGIMTLVAANLFEWFQTTSGIAKAINEFKNIPKNIAGLVKGLGKVLSSASDSLAKATNAYVLANAAKAILAMAAAILLLKDIPKDDLNKALAAVSFMGFIVYMLMKGIGYLSMGLAAKSEKVIDNSTKNLLQINSNLGRFAGVAMLVFAIGGSIWLVATALKAVVDASNAMQGNGNIIGGFSAAVQTLTDIIKLVGGIAIALMALTTIKLNLPVLGKFVSVNGSGGSNGGAMAAIGVALIGIGVAIASIAAGLVLISKYDIKENAIVAMVGIVSAIVLMTYVLGQSARWANTGALLALALDMFVMSIAVGIIVAEVAAISLLMTGASFLGKENIILEAAAAIAIVIVAMGGALGLMSKGLSKMKKPGDIIAPILSMAAVIAVVGWTLKTITEAAGSNLQGTVIAFFAIIAVLGMVVTVIDKTVGQIRRGKSDDMTNVFLSLAAIFAAVGVCIALLALGVKNMQGASAGTIVAAIALIVFVSAALAIVAKIASTGGSVVAETLESMAIAFVAIGAAVLLIAEAAKVMNGLDPLAFAGAIAIVVVLAGLFAILAGVSAVNAGFADNLAKVGKALKDFGIGAILFAAAALILGVAMGVMAAGIGALAAGLGVLANAFHEHWLTVVVLIGVIMLMAFVLHQLVKMCEPIPRIVEDVAEKVTGTAEKAGSGLLNALKKGGSSIASWWQKAQPQTKAMIVTGIATLCAAILKASPQVLKTAKALLGKLIQFLVDVIPDVVSGLLTILIKLINSLADEIRKNSAKIAYAVWNLLESILEVVLEVLGQLVMMLLGGGKIGQTVATVLTESKGYLRSNLAEMKQYAEQAEDLANGATEGWLRISEQQGSPFASKAMDDLNEYEKQLASAEDQAKETQKAVASINGNNEIPANIAELYAQKGNRQAAENAGEESGEGFLDGLGNTIKDKAGDIMPDGSAMFNAGFDTGEYAGEGLINGENFALEEGQSETYTTTTTTIQEGPVAAIEDSEGDIRKATEEHIQKPVLDMVGDDGYRRQLYTRGYSNAGYILRGLKEGMEAQMDMVGNVSFKTAETINKDFIGPMQIMSPSKLFYEHGAYILQGLANGMEANMDLAAGATSDMSDTIVNSFAAPLDYISKMASGEIQYDPTIRPVLDSSNIGRGAGAINSMFRNQNVSLSGFSGQLAADIGQLDSRNSDVVDELRALREEMAIMGEEISNMQVVMDTGALVGATAGPMDKALGQRAVRFGRGN